MFSKDLRIVKLKIRLVNLAPQPNRGAKSQDMAKTCYTEVEGHFRMILGSPVFWSPTQGLQLDANIGFHSRPVKF